MAQEARRGVAARAHDGREAFVDWASATIPVHDRHTGEVWQAPLFVATLGRQQLHVGRGTTRQADGSLVPCTFEHCGGIPALVVPDNAKTAVGAAHRYDPLNPTYHNLAQHCGFGIMPARP